MQEDRIKPRYFNEGKFEMNITKWVDNKLMKFISFFENLEDAIENCKDFDGSVKIYDHKRRICHSQEKPREDSYC